MWIKRDFQDYFIQTKALPVKVLKGPRQSGKTSLLQQMGKYKEIYFDDLGVRKQAQDNPKLFFDQFESTPLLLDEATLAPNIFPELKRRVDLSRRENTKQNIDIWITGSNQTLLQKNVQESLAGRASYFDLNTLSLHELGRLEISEFMMRGGWPELHVNVNLTPHRYLDDLISTFVEKDIVSAAGIERKEAFNRCMMLAAGRVGQLMNYSDIAKNVRVEMPTVQSWLSILEQNGLMRKLSAYSTNLNNRLIKSPKYYFEDVGMATRLQGWREFGPICTSPQYGFLIENIAIGEVSRFFINSGEKFNGFYLRTKEKVEVDLLIQLPNQRYIAAEIKTTPQDWTAEQHKLVDALDLNVIEKWCLSPTAGPNFHQVKTISFLKIWSELKNLTAL